MRRFDPWLVVGLASCAVLVFVAVYGPRVAPFEPIYSALDVPDRAPYPLPPGDPFIFGSDPAGRDLLSVILYGAGTTLAIVTVAGLARLGLGVLLASFSSRAAGVFIDGLADLASAVPSTVVAVLIVLAFGGDTGAAFFVVALLLTGWAGPYRVVRAELRRLRSAPFTEGARALGVGGRRLFVEHHLPHLIPVLALSASQQVAAALVALAELGVIGIFVGPVRSINLTNSLSLVRLGERAGGFVSESSEWSAMLASGRAQENLYVTRWVILVPGLAIAFAVLAVSLLGVGIARHYRRRNVFNDLIPSRVMLASVLLVAICLPAAVLPDRYAAARDWARAAADDTVIGADIAQAFRDAGLAPASFDRTSTALKQIAPATIDVRGPAGQFQLQQGDALLPILAGRSSGGSVDAPLVFVGWGLSPADFPPQHLSAFGAPDFGTAISTWEDDYKKVDVRGKVAVILRLTALRQGTRFFTAPPPDELIHKAIAHGAAAIILIDNFHGGPGVIATSPNTYKRLAAEDPISSPTGVPTVVITPDAADPLLGPANLRATDILRSVNRDLSRDYTGGASLATELPETALVSLSVASVTESAHSLVALTPPRADGRRLVLWAIGPSAIDGSRSGADALAAAVRASADRGTTGVAFVLFDPHGDATANAKELVSAIGAEPDLVVMLDTVGGDHLRFLTIYDDLFLPIDHYADQVGAPHERTIVENEPDWPTGLAALGRFKYVLVRGSGPPAPDPGSRSDVAALAAYIVARYQLGAPELHR